MKSMDFQTSTIRIMLGSIPSAISAFFLVVSAAHGKTFTSNSHGLSSINRKAWEIWSVPFLQTSPSHLFKPKSKPFRRVILRYFWEFLSNSTHIAHLSAIFCDYPIFPISGIRCNSSSTMTSNPALPSSPWGRPRWDGCLHRAPSRRSRNRFDSESPAFHQVRGIRIVWKCKKQNYHV